MSAERTYKFEVAMTCGGCSGAVSRVLGKMEGLTVDTVSWETKRVVARSATGSPSFDEVKAKIDKTGKKVLRGEDNGEVKFVAEA